MEDLIIHSVHRLDDGDDLKFHTQHAAEVGFSRPLEADIEDIGTAEMLAATIVMEQYVKSRPYPYHLVAEGFTSSSTVTVYWTEDNEIRFIEGPDGYYYDKKDVGDIVHYSNAAPGIGHARFVIHRKDEKGLWGLCIEDTRWVPDGDFYR